MFTCRSCRSICPHCSGHWRYATAKTPIIVLMLVSMLMFELIAVSYLIRTVSINDMASSAVKENQRIYTEPVCHARTRFVYIKMIKCASTTLTDVFRRFGLQRRLSFILPPKGRIYVGWPYEVDDSFYRPSKSLSGFDILCDHAVYNRQTFSELMGPGTVYITSMREPYSQVKSTVNYYNILNISGVPMSVSSRFTEFMFNIEKYEAVYKSTGASSTRYCVPDGFSMIHNLMSFNMGFPTGGFRSADEDLAYDNDRVRQWLSELDAKFSLVIIVEHFHESMVLLRQQMCWNLTDILFRAVNAKMYEYRKEKSADLVKIYSQRSSLDHQLYQHFNDSLWKKIAAQDSSFWDEVSHYRNVNKQVNKFCAEVNGTTVRRSFVIPESVWNAEFHITTEFCRLLAGDLLERLQVLYESQPPTDIKEKKPSRTTC